MLIRMEYHLQQGLPLSYRNASLFQGFIGIGAAPIENADAAD